MEQLESKLQAGKAKYEEARERIRALKRSQGRVDAQITDIIKKVDEQL